MPAEPMSTLEVVESQAVLEFAVVVFDPPPDLSQAHQLLDGGGLGQGRQPVIGGFVFSGGPFDQQPTLWGGAVNRYGFVAAVRLGEPPSQVTLEL